MKKGVEDLPVDNTKQMDDPDGVKERQVSATTKRSKSVNTRSSKVLEGLVWVAVVLIVIAVLGFGVWGEIRLANIVEVPEIPVNGALTESPVIADTTEELNSEEYRQTLQEIYQQNLEAGNSVAAVSQAVNDKLGEGGDKAYIAQVRLTEIELMNSNGNYDRALELLGGLKAEDLELSERVRYYAALSAAYQALANFDLANEYARLTHETEKALEAQQ